jgi:Sulfatase.
MVTDTLMSILLYANVLYYRFFNDYITLPTLFQTQNFGDVSGSVPSLIRPFDFLFFLDLIFLFLLLGMKVVKVEGGKVSRKRALAIVTLALGLTCLNLGLAESDRPQLLTRGFDRNYIVKYLGLYNYTIYDAVESTKASAQKVMADSDDVIEIINYTKSNYVEPNPEYFGIAEGKNVIFIHLESMQNFLIDYQLDGEEVTPFLNRLAKDKNSLYFDHFYHQTAQGKTADAEFLLENSLFGLPQGAAFITNGTNTYEAAPAIVSQTKGYTTAVFHGNSGTFWNRNEIYKSFGYDYFFDINSYNVASDEDLAEYGLMDKPFFEQSIDYLVQLPQPFYVKLITVSNHYPYKIDEDLTTIGKHHTGDKSVDQYFQTARYADEAIEQFFNELKETGLYENSIIILYGDHYGISENHNDAMETVLGTEVTPVVSADLQRVPLIIHMPGLKGQTIHTYGGQIDLLPTVLHLLGIDTKDYIQFGTDLLAEHHDQVVAFRNGDYVSPTIYCIDGTYYDPLTGEEIKDPDLLKVAEQLKTKVENKLKMSDEVINGDLLRFYTPPGFTPVDPSKYNYKDQEL